MAKTKDDYYEEGYADAQRGIKIAEGDGGTSWQAKAYREGYCDGYRGKHYLSDPDIDTSVSLDIEFPSGTVHLDGKNASSGEIKPLPLDCKFPKATVYGDYPTIDGTVHRMALHAELRPPAVIIDDVGMDAKTYRKACEEWFVSGTQPLAHLLRTNTGSWVAYNKGGYIVVDGIKRKTHARKIIERLGYQVVTERPKEW